MRVHPLDRFKFLLFGLSYFHILLAHSFIPGCSVIHPQTTANDYPEITLRNGTLYLRSVTFSVQDNSRILCLETGYAYYTNCRLVFFSDKSSPFHVFGSLSLVNISITTTISQYAPPLVTSTLSRKYGLQWKQWTPKLSVSSTTISHVEVIPDCNLLSLGPAFFISVQHCNFLNITRQPQSHVQNHPPRPRRIHGPRHHRTAGRPIRGPASDSFGDIVIQNPKKLTIC